MKNITIQVKEMVLLVLAFTALASGNAFAQVYEHDFGAGTINTHPYTAAPSVLHPDLSGSLWTNSTGSWTNFGGASGQAIALANSSGTPTITLTFTVAGGKQLAVESFDFWRQRSNTGAQNWSLAINGITVGSGSVPTSGSATGTTLVAAPVTGLTGTVTVELSLSGATGSGTFRLDDFTLNGTVTSTCTAPVISAVSPASAPVNTVVTITGSGFEAGTGTTSVQINGVPVFFTVLSDTTIEATVNAGVTTGMVTVTTDASEGEGPVFTLLTSDCPDTAVGNELYISELYDQKAGSGGMIELFNPTASTITFNGDYVIQRYGNITDASPTPGYILTLTGSVGPGMTFLVAATDPNLTICAAPPSTNGNGFAAGYNENDKIELLKNNIAIDVVHTPASQPGFTMIRQFDAAAPSAVYDENDWNITLHDNSVTNTYCSNLGIHAADTDPAVTITQQPQDDTVCENGQAVFTVTLSDPAGFTFQWKRLNAAGSWVNVANNANYSGAGTNTLTITDTPLSFDNNQYYCEITSATCTLITTTVQLEVSPLPVVTVTTVPTTCLVPTGSITLTPVVGEGLTYSLNGIDFQNSNTFTNVAAGNYTVTVMSSDGCIATFPAIVDPAVSLPVATVVVVQPTCTSATGSIEVTGPLGLGITYSIDGVNFQTGTTFEDLDPGTYTVTAINLLGCISVTANITINPVPAGPAMATTTVTQPTCTTATGTITVTAPIGAGLTYSINGTDFQAGTTFANLSPGDYSVTVQNADGCTSVTAPITINAIPAAPAVAITTVTQPTCTVATGTITVTAPTGAGLTYSINGTDFQAGTTFSNLTAGNYSITVQNGNGCTSVTAPITINAAPDAPAVATVTITQPTCTSSTGSIEVTSPTGAGFTYSINGTDFQAGTTFTNLDPGTYYVTVQNADGCTSVTSQLNVTGAPAAAPVAVTTVTQPTCAVQTGTITITSPTGADLAYSINGTDFQSGTTFANLAPGDYSVTVQNADGCTSVTTPITINPAPGTPAVATTTVTQPTCAVQTGTITVTAPTGAGLSYSINGTDFQSGTTFANLPPGNYSITVQNGNGCTSVTTPITINAAPGTPAVATTTVIQPTCTVTTGTITVTAPTGIAFTYSINGIDFQAGTSFADLAPGSYTVTVQSEEGCTSVTTPIIINAPNTPAVATTTVTQPTCATATGTIAVTTPIGAGLTYSINGTDFQAGTTFANVAPGSYNVTVQNEDGCTSVTETITINEVQAPLMSGVQECRAFAFGKSYILEGLPMNNSFNPADASYEWRVGNTVVGIENTFNVTEYLADTLETETFPIVFELTVTLDNGCENTITFVVEGIMCDIPKGISPNNDGKNDSFDLTGLNAKKVSIFNRYGIEVYSRDNYNNEWYGQADNGNELPTGTYYYMIEAGTKPQTGWVYINREE